MQRLHRVALPTVLLLSTYYCVHRSADLTIHHNEVFVLLFASRYPYLKRFDEAGTSDQSSADFCELLDQTELFKKSK